MNKYYITFGSEGQVFKGGWVEIHAENEQEAQEKFINQYGNNARSKDGVLRYSFMYDMKRFKETVMFENGNLGNKCHEIIK